MTHHETGLYCVKIVIEGVVQGVGFRPFVLKSARDLGVSGTVINTSQGVEIMAQAGDEAIERFTKRLQNEPPVLSKITGFHVESIPTREFIGFTIEQSKTLPNTRTLMSPDVALCAACESELKDPENRRFGYPFTNCTDCGPRFSIVTALPYDRPKTTMMDFPMCPDCRVEYEDPYDRRFHAQATCCPMCGPKVFLAGSNGRIIPCESPVDEAVSLLKKGRIVAVKGIGGFHLAADAENHEAVARLRELKERGGKPFAVMAKSISVIREFAHVTDGDVPHLTGPAHPIVIMKKKTGPDARIHLSPDVAPSNPMIGVMLPYTPLHVLMFDSGMSVLVMTSGNRKDEPITCDNDEAVARLGSMVDAFLFHNRRIHIRSDDSVGRPVDNGMRLIRRSRGYAPMPVTLPFTSPDILATGGNMKNTLCVVNGSMAFLSPHIGDLETPEGLGFFHETAGHMTQLFNVNPAVIALDLHPDYITADYGKHWPGARVIPVQHHHAHIVSCMMENGVTEKVIGFSFDGTGYGDDGTVWGGEILISAAEGYERAAHIGCVPMPGSAAAVRDPWRMSVSWLYHTFGEAMWALDIPLFTQPGEGSDQTTNKTLVAMMGKKLNSPLTSSMGRLFDAVAAIMGLCRVNTFDAQAAMALEAVVDDHETGMYDWTPCLPADGPFPWVVDMKPLIRAVVDDLEHKIGPGVISARFHHAMIQLFADIGKHLSEKTGIRDAALSGGVFQNAKLLSGLNRALKEKGLTVLTHTVVPANDGGLCLGQAGVAAALCMKEQ
jgi:hydrogenase maturation protein HypF